LSPLQAGQAPFQGYRFRMLTRQGSSAPGGARLYLADNRLRGC